MNKKIERVRIHFINDIRKYDINDILYYINIFSSDVFYNKGLYYPDNCSLKRFNIKTSRWENYYILPWELIDLAYYAIKHSDYSCEKRKFNDTNEFFNLYSLYRYYFSLNNNFHRHKRNILPVFFLMASEQVKFQNIERCIDNFNRESYILNVILPNVDNKIDIDAIVDEEFGVSQAFIGKWILIFTLLSFSNNKLNDVVEQTIDFYKDDKDKVYRIINYYSFEIKDARESEYGKQILYTKPFFRQSTSAYLSISCYLNLFIFEHCIYWIVRKHYERLNSYRFTNAYGYCFELYFKELLNDYVDTDNFHKIKEDNKSKRADWYVKLDNFEMIIEQKSALAPLGIKSQNPDVDSIEKFIKDNIDKAVKQLNQTQSSVPEYENTHKIILFYDDYILPQANQYLIDSNIDDCRIFNINEMETILYTYKHNRNKFDGYIKELCEHFQIRNDDEKCINSILFNQHELENKHIKEDKYTKYYKRVEDLMLNINNN